MATRQGTHVHSEDATVNYNWSGLLNGDSGTAVGVSDHNWSYTMQVTGTFGAGGSVSLQGSNNNVDFIAIDDAAAVAVAATTTKIWKLSQLPRYIKPVVTAGDGTTNLTVNIVGIVL